MYAIRSYYALSDEATSEARDIITRAFGPEYSLDRITSYNVCYTKLLRLVVGHPWLQRAGAESGTAATGQPEILVIASSKKKHWVVSYNFV